LGRKLILFIIIAGGIPLLFLSFGLKQEKPPSPREDVQKGEISHPRESLVRKLSENRIILPDGKIAYKRMELTPAELSLFIEEEYGERIPPDIKWWKLDARGNLVILSGEASLTKAKEDLSPQLSEVLPDDLPFKVSFHLNARNGIGRVSLFSFKLAGIPFPVSLAINIFSSISPEDEERLRRGFELPPGFNEIIVQEGVFLINP
jgi:hypothetical protein